MSDQAFTYTFNIQGNSESTINSITQNVNELNAQIGNSTNVFQSWQDKFLAFNHVSQLLSDFSQTLNNVLVPGAELNSQIADLSVISGETGENLKIIEGYARDAAKTFGGSAADSVESYKLLLSQLSPELAKTPEALKTMGDNVSILSKTMGGDARAAAEVLTTAMNQYGVSIADPMAASKEMSEMMNVMAAAGKEGSAKLPAIKQALEQCGMAAKGANVSFVETNAAIQVLDKAGKKGAEGGVALRNVMATLSTGRFLPKDVQEELKGAGIDINQLGDKSKTLTERLTPLKKVMNDSALFTKLFEKENSSAAMALVKGITEVDRYSAAISGTNTAFDQAAIVMETYKEKQARVQAQFDDFKISIFNVTGDMGIWLDILVGALSPISQMIPLITSLGTVFTVLKGLAVVSCRAIGAAIMNIPIVGWIAAAIAAIIALGIYFWNTSAEFRAVLKGLWAAFKLTFSGIWELAKTVFASIGDLIKAAFALDGDGISQAIDKLKGGFSDFGSATGKAFNDAYDAEIKASEKPKDKPVAKGGAVATPKATTDTDTGGGSISSGISNIGGSTDKTDKIKNINVTIDKLIGKFEIHTTNLHEDISRVKQMVGEALADAVNDVNYAL